MTMITRDWLGLPPRPLTQTDADASRQGTEAPMTPGAMRLAPALDGELIWSDSVPDAAPLRAVGVEALVWSTMTIPPHARPWPLWPTLTLRRCRELRAAKRMCWVGSQSSSFSSALRSPHSSAALGSLSENDGYLRTEDRRSRRVATSPL
jgi:hypothetical protein